jgi:hypothetical protein
LQPDIVGCHGNSPQKPSETKQHKTTAIVLAWWRIEIAVKVKRNVLWMMIQATMYACALLLLQTSQLWVLVISLNQKMAKG